mmetsp:Transcript_31559/g.93942  ORF Transcript_31559/g.93942 Transcript_31559/m.93942 type:complete len:217 (-) Transcript_31559:83-733(-)
MADKHGAAGDADPAAADGCGGALLAAVLDALQLPEERREEAMGEAVETLLKGSDDRAESVRMLSKALDMARPRLPTGAAPLLSCLAGRLQAEVEGVPRPKDADKEEEEEGEDDSSDEDERGNGDGEGEGRPFCLGPVRLPLATLMSIANGLEPDDLSPAAQSCKSLCIAININLQYILFLVRLIRLIVLGPEVARAMREREELGEDSESTEASSGD